MKVTFRSTRYSAILPFFTITSDHWFCWVERLPHRNIDRSYCYSYISLFLAGKLLQCTICVTIYGGAEGTAHKEIDVMVETNTANFHARGAREFAPAFAKDVSENSKATAEEATKVLEKTYSIVATGAADFNQQWIEIVRFNTNSTLDLVQQLLGVKSPAEFLELSSAHFRKQFETFAEQSKHLMGMAQKMTTHAVEPLKAGIKSALSKTT
jgi:phasin